MSSESESYTEREIEEMRESLINQIEGMTPVQYALFVESVRKKHPDIFEEFFQRKIEDWTE